MGDDPTLWGGAAVLLVLGLLTVGHWLWIAPPAEPAHRADPPEPRRRLRDRLALIEEEPPVYRARYTIADGPLQTRHAGLPPRPPSAPPRRQRVTTFGPQGGARVLAAGPAHAR